jgi:uncharacterized protein with ParB-like and HNH nuclease domain
MMEIKEIFEAYGKSSWHLLCETGVGYYIPSYQREYSWGKQNIERLFEDTSHGIRLLLQSDDSITFIGTIITIHDTKYNTVEPIIKQHMPKTVMLIIDGQQRLVTLSLLLTALHDSIRMGTKRFSKDDESAYAWIFDRSREICSYLSTTFQIDMVHGQSNEGKEYKWYPRMIRSLEDTWSREVKTAKYNSPIAHYLFEYISHVKDDPNEPYRHVIPDGIPAFKAKHEVVLENWKLIKAKIKQVSDGSGSDFEFPSLKDIVKSKTFQETIFKDDLPEDVKIILLDESEDKKVDHYKKLFRIIVLAKFVMDRMALTVVTAKNEDYAFDMFEALNTTGEPLTAFETFKPKVIQSEGLSDYESSESRKSMLIIESYLDTYKKAQDKQKATTNVLIPFALAETGFKLSKRLSDQRKYIKESFDSIKSIEEKRGFIKHLADIALFLRDAWPDRTEDKPKFDKLDTKDIDYEVMCLDVLRTSNHSITIAPIVRFYSLYNQAPPQEKEHHLNEFKEAIKVIASFSVLWRGSRQGTEQIDSHYRKIMESGIPEIAVPPLARNSGVKPSSETLKKALRHILAKHGDINNKEEWVKKAWKQPIYSINKPICRLLLLAATHDTCPDDENPGLIKKAKCGYLNMLNLDHWWREEKLTIEHIAPQDDTDKLWDTKIYDDVDYIHCLGNLTLLPAVENSVASNSSWVKKRLIYRLLSATSAEDHNMFMEEAKKEGITLKATTEEILLEAKYLPYVYALGKLETEWTFECIEKRSKRMAEIIWDRLSPCLGYEA